MGACPLCRPRRQSGLKKNPKEKVIHFSVLVNSKTKQVVLVATSCGRNTGCSERNLCWKVRNSNKPCLKNSRIYNFRLSRSLRIGSAKPCVHCKKTLVAYNRGVLKRGKRKTLLSRFTYLDESGVWISQDIHRIDSTLKTKEWG